MDRRTAAIAALLPMAWAAPASAGEAGGGALTERLRTGAIQGADLSGDVRPEALALHDAAAERGLFTLADARAGKMAPQTALHFEPPETIRVWRRSVDGSTSSCSGRVDDIPFEQYVRGVLPHEWIPSWPAESLKAGAVAIRTYGAFWVEAGGRYDCADVDDTTATQVYKDELRPETDAAVEATAGHYVVEGAGDLVFAEYSAENGNPTEFGVDEPLCEGEEVFGHGRGTCQWGSQRWAQDGRSFDWIVTHYYPGSSILDARARLGAVEIERDHPETLVAGASGEAIVRFENTGTEPWASGSTELVTAPANRDSRLYDPATWEGADRPASVAEATAGGETGAFVFSLRAPDVGEAAAFEETFQLAHDGQRFGPTISLVVEVAPADGGPGGGGGLDEEAGASAPNVFGCHVRSSGRAGAFALAPLCAIVLLCGLVTRRRRSAAI